MIFAAIVVFFTLAALFLFMNRKSGIVTSPSSLFVLMQVAIFSGTIPLIDDRALVDQIYLELFPVLLASFICGHLAFGLFSRHDRTAVESFGRRPLTAVECDLRFDVFLWSAVTFSVFVSLGYTYFVGYNVFTSGIVAMASGEELRGVALMRVDMYSGPTYFAPGYVNQFKNVLLPALLAFVLCRALLRREKLVIEVIVVGALAVLSVTFLAATGQRYPLAAATLVIVVLARVSLPRNMSRWIFAIAGAGFAVFFLTTTLIIGRSDIKQVESFADLLELGLALPDRLFRSNQLAGIYGFRYVFAHNVVYGAEWFDSLHALLPGQARGRSLAAEIFRSIAGGRGTAPPTILGSIWHNFGLVGVIVVPFMLGFVYRAVHVAFAMSRRKTLFGMTRYAVLCVVIGSWATGGPMYMLNNGLLAILLLGATYRVWRAGSAVLAEGGAA